ncbi:MAG: FAD:protein FMN transferase [Gemmatimonadota bacterium]
MPSSRGWEADRRAIGATHARGVWVERETYLMGTTLRARVEAESRESGIAAIEAAFGEVRRMEGVLSTWREGTEMARLNAAPVGEWFRASGELFSLLVEARGWWRETGGAFDPGVGSLVTAWDLRGQGRRPAPAELAAALAESGFGHFELDEFRGAIRRTREGAWIDTGGFGKGAALRAAKAALLEAGVRSALLDFGGQLLAFGSQEGGSGWRVAVADPSRRGKPAARLVLHDASAATTAASERFVSVDGERLGHVLDPRSGRPVAAWGSVTVVAEDPLAADVLSTALFVLGPEEGRRWLRAHGDVRALFLEETPEGLAATWSPSLDVWTRAFALEEKG